MGDGVNVASLVFGLICFGVRVRIVKRKDIWIEKTFTLTSEAMLHQECPASLFEREA